MTKEEYVAKTRDEQAIDFWKAQAEGARAEARIAKQRIVELDERYIRLLATAAGPAVHEVGHVHVDANGARLLQDNNNLRVVLNECVAALEFRMRHCDDDLGTTNTSGKQTCTCDWCSDDAGAIARARSVMGESKENG
jgi:phytoene/squalene synthetase